MNTFDPDTSTLYLDQGTDVVIEFTLTDDNGATLITSGYTAKSQFRTDYTSKNVVLELSTANQRIENDNQGNFRLIFAAATTSAIKASDLDGVFDVEVTDSVGSTHRVLSGNYSISPEVTR